MEEQPPGFAAQQIEITPEKLSFSQETVRFPLAVGATTQTQLTVFYFDASGKMDITKKKKGHVVRVWDSSGVYRFRVVIPDHARAMRFMDAMASMALRASGHDLPP